MRKDGVGGPSLLSLFLSFKEVWLLWSLLLLCLSTSEPAPSSRESRAPSVMSIGLSVFQSRLKNLQDQERALMGPAATSGPQHSRPVPGLKPSPSTIPPAVTLLWDGPWARHEHFWRLEGGGSAGVVGQWPLGYTLPTLSFPVRLLSDHHSSLLYLCLMLFSSSVFYFPFVEPHLH